MFSLKMVIFFSLVQLVAGPLASAANRCEDALRLPDLRIQRELYPPLEPATTGFLDVGDGHQLYYEVSGNPTGEPIVLLHGGPGSSTSPKMRQFFDPKVYRIILFDQRGSGKSLFENLLNNNNTAALVSDMEKLRLHLGIKQWTVFGGSWGSTLALAYSIRHASAVKAMILRGIFLGTPEELDLLNPKKISGEMRPHWRNLLSILTPQEKQNPMEAYLRRLFSEDEGVRQEAAVHWLAYEGAMAKAVIPHEPLTAQDLGKPMDALVRNAQIELSYISQSSWLTGPDSILAGVEKIRHIPTVIVQGGADHIVPPANGARALREAFPEAHYIEVPDNGHSTFEPGIASALVQATDALQP
jgi:proline iminopeptidase